MESKKWTQNSLAPEMNFSMDLNTNIDITMKGKGSDHLANALSPFSASLQRFSEG